ncbi:MAG TPA: hypothetical protein VJ201_09325 [Candidatus Babeliales bacterium]|nr:hypothetical protein [Candidatus Babeliales bacterium]
MATLQECKKQLNSLFYKTPAIIKELQQLNEMERTLLEKENILGTAITTAAQLYDQQAGGNTAQQVTEVVTTALELSEHKYGQVASKVITITSAVITSINDQNHIDPLNIQMKYYPLRFENDKGGWLLGHDTSTGKVYLVFNQCVRGDGVETWKTEHQEIIMESAYQFNLIDNEVARIIAGDYQLGSKITVSTQYNYH